MELYQLKGFAAVAELGQLTRAAERLHISQPALSAQIKALEDELAVTLFERGAAGMTLTAASCCPRRSARSPLRRRCAARHSRCAARLPAAYASDRSATLSSRGSPKCC